MSKQERWVLHADMDAFYASVEQRDHPELRGQPVIIGARGPRGVVSAASYEARKFGVRSAMPGFQARKLCPHGVFLDGDMNKYAAVSKKVQSVFYEFSDQIEPLALDEAFIDITGSLGLFGSPTELGKKLKLRVQQEVELVVSVGISTNKLLAKMACSEGKPDGLFVLLPAEVESFLGPKPVRALFGVGPKTAEQLTNMGISTLAQLGRASHHLLAPVFGEQAGAMRSRARGIDLRPVEGSRETKSIGEEATFADNVTDEARLVTAIITHSEEVAARARRSGLMGQTVALKVKLARRKTWGDKAVASFELFPVLSRQTKLSEPSSDGQLISRAAIELLKKLQLKEAVRLVGVSLSDLVRTETPRQLSLFERGPTPTASLAHLPRKAAELAAKGPVPHTRGEQLGATLDQITARFGAEAVVRGGRSIVKINASDKIKVGAVERLEPEPDP